MKHNMRLHNSPFEMIKNKKKTIELRLNDEKRKLIKKEDIIIFENRFTKELLEAKVTNIYHFNTFNELYENLDKESIGYEKDKPFNPKDMEIYYSIDQQKEHGVVGIEFELIDNQKKEIVYNENNLKIEDMNNVVRRAKLLIINDFDEILLCYSNKNYFFLGGHVDNDETDMQCLHRELLEEAGVDIGFDYLKTFMTIKYFNENYPEEGKNTLSISNYYILNCNVTPKYENISLTKDEKAGEFKLVYLKKDIILKQLEESLDTAKRKNVTLDTIAVLKEFLES